jgi:hypothetical protein
MRKPKTGSPKRHLIAARDLIADPNSWTQGAYARDKKRAPTKHSTKAVSCWCLIGAVQAIDSDNSEEALEWLRITLRHDYGEFVSVSHFNDTHSHGEVLRALDRAIEAAPDT